MTRVLRDNTITVAGGYVVSYMSRLSRLLNELLHRLLVLILVLKNMDVLATHIPDKQER